MAEQKRILMTDQCYFIMSIKRRNLMLQMGFLRNLGNFEDTVSNGEGTCRKPLREFAKEVKTG